MGRVCHRKEAIMGSPTDIDHRSRRSGGEAGLQPTLSDNRAQNVHRALRDILGSDLAVRSVEAKGVGEKEASAGGVRAGAKDRRVEVMLNGFTVLSLDSG
jgi:hypothetical protein